MWLQNIRCHNVVQFSPFCVSCMMLFVIIPISSHVCYSQFIMLRVYTILWQIQYVNASAWPGLLCLPKHFDNSICDIRHFVMYCSTISLNVFIWISDTYTHTISNSKDQSQKVERHFNPMTKHMPACLSAALFDCLGCSLYMILYILYMISLIYVVNAQFLSLNYNSSIWSLVRVPYLWNICGLAIKLKHSSGGTDFIST